MPKKTSESMMINSYLKKTVIFLTCCWLFTSQAAATPLTNYDLGKFSIETAVWQGNAFVQNNPQLFDLSQIGLNGAVTVAAPYQTAVRYRYDQLAFGTGAMCFQDICAVYKINFVTMLFDKYFGKAMADNSKNQEVQVEAAKILQEMTNDNLFGTFVGVSNVNYGSAGINQTSVEIGYLCSLRFLPVLSIYSELSMGTHMQFVSDSGIAYTPTDNFDLSIGYRNLCFEFNNPAQYVEKSGYYLGVTFKN